MLKPKGDWSLILKDEYTKDYYKDLMLRLDNDYADKTIYPKKEDIFKALDLTSFKDCKVIIIGQDPYINENEAHGLAFSIIGNKISPSLRNIFKEMHDDVAKEDFKTLDLTYLAKQGVLLLNSILTVEKGKSNSHYNYGWQNFTDEIIRQLNTNKEYLVFILWGNNAKKKKKLITNKKHLILEASHPSPLSASRGFFGCRHFSKTNAFLKNHDRDIINW